MNQIGLNDDIKVLDGGLGVELETRGEQIAQHKLWAAHLLSSKPDALFQAHLDYFQAGADIATTATYQASVEGFQAERFSVAQSMEIMKRSAELAREAADRAKTDRQRQKQIDESHTCRRRSGESSADESLSDSSRTLFVAGSCGPYAAYLADRSEYSRDYEASNIKVETLRDFHRPRIEALRSSGVVDLFLFETFPDPMEAHAVLSLLKEFPDLRGRVWFSFACRSQSQCCSGANFHDASAALLRADGYDQYISGLGVNCTPPKYLRPLLLDDRFTATLTSINTQRNTKVKLIAYPNEEEEEWELPCSAVHKAPLAVAESSSKRPERTYCASLPNNNLHWSLLRPNTSDLREQRANSEKETRWSSSGVVESWMEIGGQFFGAIGGCCSSGPQHIADIRRRVDEYRRSALRT